MELLKYEEAIQCFKSSLKLDPEDVVSLNNIGYSLNQLQKHKEAVRPLKKAININPTYYLPYYNMAHSMFSMKRFDTSSEFLEIASSLCPKDDTSVLKYVNTMR